MKNLKLYEVYVNDRLCVVYATDEFSAKIKAVRVYTKQDIVDEYDLIGYDIDIYSEERLY